MEQRRPKFGSRPRSASKDEYNAYFATYRAKNRKRILAIKKAYRDRQKALISKAS